MKLTLGQSMCFTIEFSQLLFNSWNDKFQLIDPDLSVKMEYLQRLQVGNIKRIWVFRVWVHLRPMGVEINLKNKTRDVSHCGLAI
jgi:hypothetical protein